MEDEAPILPVSEANHGRISGGIARAAPIAPRLRGITGDPAMVRFAHRQDWNVPPATARPRNPLIYRSHAYTRHLLLRRRGWIACRRERLAACRPMAHHGRRETETDSRRTRGPLRDRRRYR